MRPLRLPPRCLAITPGDVVSAGERTFLARLRAAERGGIRGFVLREPSLPDGPYLALARAARELLGEDAWLALHDRPHLVAAAGADGVHLGFRSLPPSLVPSDSIRGAAVGYSAHRGDPPGASRGADYVTFGPVFETASKAGRLAPVGVAGLAERAARGDVPVLALGGVTPERAAACLAAGAYGVAAIGAVLGAPDVEAGARALAGAVGAARARGGHAR